MKGTLSNVLALLLLLAAAGCASSRQGREAPPAPAWRSGVVLPPHTTSLRRVLEHEIGRDGRGVPDYRCTVGAHRGSSLSHRENTLAALRAADKDPRFAFVEFDVQFSEDNRIVIFHDRTLLRLFGSLSAVGRTAYAELLERSDGEIALYEEAMAILTKKVNIEIKSQGDDEEDRRLVDAIIADIRTRGRTDDIMLSSISSDVVRYIARTYPDVPTGQIYWLTASTYLPFERLTERLYERIADSQADYLLLHVANLRNIENLLRLKPPHQTIAFWDFDDRMYLVHKDPSDRLWGESAWSDYWQRVRFVLRWITG